MKKLFAALISLTLLCSCGTGQADETESFSETSETTSASEKKETFASTALSAEPVTESETSVTASQTESSIAETTAAELITMESGYCAFDDAELLPESEVIAIAEQVRDGFKQSDLIKDYAEIDDMGIPFDGSYDIMIVPADVDFEEYCADEKNFPMYYEDEHENGVIEKTGENDIYSQWRNAYTEIRRMYQNDVPTVLELDREYRRVFLKNFVRNENNAFSYTGKMTAEDITRNFDIFTHNTLETKICRRVAENSGSFKYEFYCARIIGGDWGLNDEAVIEGRSVEISKADGSFNSEGTTFYRAGYEIPGTAPDMGWEWED